MREHRGCNTEGRYEKAQWAPDAREDVPEANEVSAFHGTLGAFKGAPRASCSSAGGTLQASWLHQRPVGKKCELAPSR